MTAGVILAGGRSTRFEGGDKAVCDLAGRPMIRHVADRLESVVDELVVNCRAEQVDPIATALDGLDPQFAVDREADEGPMAGIATGLAAVDAEYAAVVACDMPFVDPEFLAYLRERADDCEAAVPRPDDWFQTTQAVYHATAMQEACEAALTEGAHKIIEPLFDLDYTVVEGSEIERHTTGPTFRNVNTREELATAARRLSE
ncbi:MAG: molybdenum cofactor guanylyltransferase [Halobaculum sp.]